MRFTFSTNTRLIATVPVIALVALLALPVKAANVWTWSFTGDKLSASGTLLTTDTPDGAGYYLITGITGQRNGVEIVGLQAPGSSIPGNEGYPVDNLIKAGGDQLTDNGFGFALADDTHSNPYFASHLPTPGYIEFYTFSDTGSMSTELPVAFSATMTSSVPEPTSSALFGGGIFAAGMVVRRHSRRASKLAMHSFSISSTARV